MVDTLGGFVPCQAQGVAVVAAEADVGHGHGHVVAHPEADTVTLRTVALSVRDVDLDGVLPAGQLYGFLDHSTSFCLTREVLLSVDKHVVDEQTA